MHPHSAFFGVAHAARCGAWCAVRAATVSFLLNFTYPEEYPDVIPVIALREVKGLDEAEVETLRGLLASEVGAFMCYLATGGLASPESSNTPRPPVSARHKAARRRSAATLSSAG